MVDPVVCRSDTLYPERPTLFYHADQQWIIQNIIARWRTPQGYHFRVRTTTDQLFELSYNEADDRWLIKPI